MPIESKPVTIDCLIQGHQLVNFEIDSGSHLSTINLNKLCNLDVHVRPTKIRAKGYSNSEILFKGEVNLSVKFHSKTIQHTFLVVNDERTSLLGRDLCGKLGIKIQLPIYDQAVIMLFQMF